MSMFMPDSVNVADLPPGYPAYLGYTDGMFGTAAELERRFPAARLVLLTVNGSTMAAHGARVLGGDDSEPGNLTAVSAAGWALTQLQAGRKEPMVMYASVQGSPGYGMRDLVRELSAAGVTRDKVKLLTAHYGKGPHVCGPGSCGLLPYDADGTQYTNQFRTPAGAVVDMSVLRDDFFAAAPPAPAPTETEKLVKQLGIVRQGDTGEAVKTVQGALLARGFGIGPYGPARNGIDGSFGDYTRQAVVRAQKEAGFPVEDQDGIVGPQTWPVLLGVA